MHIKQVLFKSTFSSAILLSLIFHIIVGLALILNSSWEILGCFDSQEISQIHVSWVSLKSIGDMRIANKQEYIKNQDTKDINIQKENQPDYSKAVDSISIKVPEEKASLVSFINQTITENRNCENETGKGKAENELMKQNSIISRAYTEQADSEGSVRLPKYYFYTPPVYPRIARIRSYEGVVLISAEIDINGKVGLFKIKKSSGYTVLDRSAIDAVRSWMFKPGQRRGKPVVMWVDVPIKFKLKDPEILS